MARTPHKVCFYCNGLVTDNCEDDHFPVPGSAGGEFTVHCCVSCHDMKDRYPLGAWPVEWIEKMALDFPKLNRETKLFLAKAARLAAQHLEFNRRPAGEGAPNEPIPLANYESKFASFIHLCKTTPRGAILCVANPHILGDNYEEIVESLTRVAAADLQLAFTMPQSS